MFHCFTLQRICLFRYASSLEMSSLLTLRLHNLFTLYVCSTFCLVKGVYLPSSCEEKKIWKFSWLILNRFKKRWRNQYCRRKPPSSTKMIQREITRKKFSERWWFSSITPLRHRFLQCLIVTLNCISTQSMDVLHSCLHLISIKLSNNNIFYLI